MPMLETDWEILLDRIAGGNCIPFLGAGACAGALPLGFDIAKKWAVEFQYPLADHDDLVRVAQFVAVTYDRDYPKLQLVKWFKGVAPPDFTDPQEPHSVLAGLPLSVYMTSNYDNFMVQALERPPHWKKPQQELCRWNALLKNHPSIFDDKAAPFQPHPATPVVFHLHGHMGKTASLVLTEDDYLEFLGNIAGDENLIPRRIREAITESSFLFVGYRLADWNFRVLFQTMRDKSPYLSVAVLLPPKVSDSQRERAQKYLEESYKDMHVKVYWGTARDFCTELLGRWGNYSARKKGLAL